MNKQITYGLVLLVVVGVIAGALVYAFQPDFTKDNQVELVNTFESNGFRFAYPENWRYQIPQTNMLFLASPEILQGGEGATITIQRSIRLSAEADSLDDALGFYLERGPLRADRAWSIVEEQRTVTFSSRDALQVTLEGAEIDGTTPMRSEIFVTRAENSLIYIFTISAPIAQWHDLEATLTAIMQSVTILE